MGAGALPSHPLIGRRIVVAGSTGSGKTTMARRLASQLDLPHIELDSLFWEPGWTPAPMEAFRERVARALSSAGWVVDGNYSQVRDLVWREADTLVWLDYSLPVILRRLARRQALRVLHRQELWNGNRDTLWNQLRTDSLFIWAVQTHKRRRAQYQEALAQPEYEHVRAVRLYSPREAEKWIARSEAPATSGPC